MTDILLPKRCGVMLLPDCTLFPHGGLPLYIFEPRYRQMLDEALEGDCFFAVARLIGEEEGSPEDYVAKVGTIGLVRASREREDGTSRLLVHGVIRVEFTEWHDHKSYPVASIKPVLSYFEPKNQEASAMTVMRSAVEDLISKLPESVKQDILSMLDRADEPGLLTDVISQQFVHDPDLRQRLLEMESISDRMVVLCDYLRQVSLDTDD
jgi:uncharacterized protein